MGFEAWDGKRAKGIDDALVAGVPVEVLVRSAAHEGPTPEMNGQPSPPTADGCCYRADRDGIVWLRPTRDGVLEQRLTNFVARITADVVEDDGVESHRHFEIEARLNGWRRQLSVPSDGFASMGWATEHLGARAVVYPGIGLRDHARAAVQILSGGIAERRELLP